MCLQAHDHDRMLSTAAAECETAPASQVHSGGLTGNPTRTSESWIKEQAASMAHTSCACCSQVACNGLIPSLLALAASGFWGGAADFPLQLSSPQGMSHTEC